MAKDLIDLFCWNLPRSIALDGAPLKSKPELHTAHCMFDILPCKNGGYAIIKSNKQNPPRFEIDHVLDQSSNNFMISWLEKQLQRNPSRADLFISYSGKVIDNKIHLVSFSDCPKGLCGPSMMISPTPSTLPPTPVSSSTLAPLSSSTLAPLSSSTLAPLSSSTIAPSSTPVPSSSTSTLSPETTMIGNDVNGHGYLIDLYCWNLPNGVAIDGAPLRSNPKLHTAHCMFDILPCRNGGYAFISDKSQDSNNPRFELDFVLDEFSNNVMITYLQEELKRNPSRADLFMSYSGYLGSSKLRMKSFSDCPNKICGQTISLDSYMSSQSPTKFPTVIGTPSPTLALGTVEIGFSQATSPRVSMSVTLVPNNGKKIRIVQDQLSWIGFGNPGPNNHMQGGMAIVGGFSSSSLQNRLLMDSFPVQIYDLTAYTAFGIIPKTKPLSFYGVFNASFTTDNTKSILEFVYFQNNEFDLGGDNLRPYLVAFGTFGAIAYHNDRIVTNLHLKSIATEALAPTNPPEELPFTVSPIFITHVVFAALAFGWLMPIGSSIALSHDRRKEASPSWFFYHWKIQIFGVICAIIGISCGIAFSDQRGTQFTNPHQFIGIVAFILVLAQPINGYFRPHKGEKFRFHWEIIHRITASCALLLGFIAIGLGPNTSIQNVYLVTNSTLNSLYVWAYISLAIGVTLIFGSLVVRILREIQAKQSEEMKDSLLKEVNKQSEEAPTAATDENYSEVNAITTV